jgi:hypothetical protein
MLPSRAASERTLFTLREMDGEDVRLRFPDSALQGELKEALKKAGIPFTLEPLQGDEYIRIPSGHFEAAKKLQRDLWGELPSGKGNIHFSSAASGEQFRKWLAAHGIEHSTVSYQRRDYIVWDGGQELARKFIDEHRGDCPRAASRATEKC